MDTTGIEVGRGLVDAARWWEDGVLGALGTTGFDQVSRTQVLLVCEVDEPGGTSASELARRLGVSRQSIHQDVRKLVGLDLVGQRPDPANRAAKRVVLTAGGRRLREAALRAADRLEGLLVERIGAERVAALRGALGQDWGLPGQLPRPAPRPPSSG